MGRSVWVWVACAVGLLAWHVVSEGTMPQTPTTTATSASTSSADVPYCDEVDTHPASFTPPGEDGSATDGGASGGAATNGTSSTGGSANNSTSGGSSDGSNGSDGSNSGSGTSGTEGSAGAVVNAAEHAGEVLQLIQQVQQQGITKAVQRFGSTVSAQLAQLASIANHMANRQEEINELFSVTLPAIERAVASRRDRAKIIREELVAVNAKLKNLVDSLDRSSYVKDQQTYMSIIDGLTRIQNSIQMRLLGQEHSYAPRLSEIHPSSLISISKAVDNSLLPTMPHEDTPAEPQTPQKSTAELEMMHALDLLEIESTELPYQSRVTLLSKKILLVLSQLITKFNAMRLKHKEYAKVNRDMWGKEVDLLQQQADDITASLESVTDQIQFYVNVHAQHIQQLQLLTAQQRVSHEQYERVRLQLKQGGKDFDNQSKLRAQQLMKMEEIVFRLLHPSDTFDRNTFAFACDGVAAGSAVVDACNVCGGANATCVDCKNVPNGDAVLDECGVCGGRGESCNYFCKGGSNSGMVMDLCGVCGGNSSLCAGCDGVPNSGLVLDACGLCGGDGSTCGAQQPQPKATPQVVPATQTVVVTKVLLVGSAFTPDWTANNGANLRNAFAKILQLDSSRVSLLSASGDAETTVVVVGVSVDNGTVGSATSTITKSFSDGSFLAALYVSHVLVQGAQLLEGPSQISQ